MELEEIVDKEKILEKKSDDRALLGGESGRGPFDGGEKNEVEDGGSG